MLNSIGSHQNAVQKHHIDIVDAYYINYQKCISEKITRDHKLN